MSTKIDSRIWQECPLNSILKAVGPAKEVIHFTSTQMYYVKELLSAWFTYDYKTRVGWIVMYINE